MLRRPKSWLPVAAALLAGCASVAPPPPAETPSRGIVILEGEGEIPTDWKTVITESDKMRLSAAQAAWKEALQEAHAKGFTAQIAAEGELLDPGIALPRPAPPPGPYLCRVVKLGSLKGKPAFNAFKPFNCYVEAEGALLTIVKQTGSQRPAGRLWPDGDTRLVFLGAMERDADAMPPSYAADAARDLAGYVERIAPFRWRMVVPWPQEDSKLDVLELIPITPEMRPAP